jgi:Uma2 family endonuclease
MATIIEPSRTYTPEELLSLPDDLSVELIDGQLVETHVSVLTGLVTATLNALLGEYVRRSSIGDLLSSETMVRCFPNRPGRVRKPDLSFVRRGRLSPSQMAAGFLTIPPDLAVEVVSPNDEAEALEAKLLDYFDAGIPLVWVIYPVARSAVILRLDGSANRIREHDELSGEAVIPGFSCRLAELFPPVPAEQPPGTEPAGQG